MSRVERFDGGGSGGTRIGTLSLPPEAPLELVDLLQTAAGPASADELADEPTAVAAFVAARPVAGPTRTTVPTQKVPTQKVPVSTTRTGIRPRRHSLQVFAAAAVSCLVLGGGLAAADVLPAPAQRWVSATLDKIGISVPSPGAAGPQSAGAGRNEPGIQLDAARTGPRENTEPVAGPLGPESLGHLTTPSAAPHQAPATAARSAAGTTSTAASRAAPSATSANTAPPRSPASQNNPSQQNSSARPTQPSSGQPAAGSSAGGSSGTSNGRSDHAGGGKAAGSPGKRVGNGQATQSQKSSQSQHSSQGVSRRSASGLAVRQSGGALDLDRTRQSGRVGAPGQSDGPR